MKVFRTKSEKAKKKTKKKGDVDGPGNKDWVVLSDAGSVSPTARDSSGTVGASDKPSGNSGEHGFYSFSKRAAATTKKLRAETADSLGADGAWPDQEQARAIKEVRGVYVWGHGTPTPVLLQLPPSMCVGARVTDVAVGKNHAAILTTLGELYTLLQTPSSTSTITTAAVTLDLTAGDSNVSTKTKEGKSNSDSPAIPSLGIGNINLGDYPHVQDIHSTSVENIGQEVQGLRGTASNSATNQVWRLYRVLGPLASKRVVRIMSAYSQCAAITEDGELYLWGTIRGEDTYLPTLVEGLPGPVSDVALGVDHAAALVKVEGKRHRQVYAWGDNHYAQLGLQDRRPRDRPALVESLATRGVSMLSSGEYHMAALTDAGKVYVWGRNQYARSQKSVPLSPSSSSTSIAASTPAASVGSAEGILGVGMLEESILLPTSVLSLTSEVIVQISCGSRFIAALTDQGKVFTWGVAESALGQGTLQWDVVEPNALPSFGEGKVVRITCGPQHMSAIQDRGQLHSWGLGDGGRLGLGKENAADTQGRRYFAVNQPTKLTSIQRRKVKYISSGGSFNAAIVCWSHWQSPFGMSLYEAMLQEKHDAMIPSLVTTCIECLSQSMSREGLFRISGPSQELDDLCDSWAKGCLLNHGMFSPHSVCTLLKSYLSELPDPLLTAHLSLDFLEVGKVTNPIEQLYQLYNLIQRLPPHNRNTLLSISLFLNDIACQADKNRMSIANLGMIFGQAFLGAESSIVNIQLKNGVASSCVTFAPLLALTPPELIAKQAYEIKDGQCALFVRTWSELAAGCRDHARKEAKRAKSTPSSSDVDGRGSTDSDPAEDGRMVFIPPCDEYRQQNHIDEQKGGLTAVTPAMPTSTKPMGVTFLQAFIQSKALTDVLIHSMERMPVGPDLEALETLLSCCVLRSDTVEVIISLLTKLSSHPLPDVAKHLLAQYIVARYQSRLQANHLRGDVRLELLAVAGRLEMVMDVLYPARGSPHLEPIKSSSVLRQASPLAAAAASGGKEVPSPSINLPKAAPGVLKSSRSDAEVTTRSQLDAATAVSVSHGPSVADKIKAMNARVRIAVVEAEDEAAVVPPGKRKVPLRPPRPASYAHDLRTQSADVVSSGPHDDGSGKLGGSGGDDGGDNDAVDTETSPSGTPTRHRRAHSFGSTVARDESAGRERTGTSELLVCNDVSDEIRLLRLQLRLSSRLLALSDDHRLQIAFKESDEKNVMDRIIQELMPLPELGNHEGFKEFLMDESTRRTQKEDRSGKRDSMTGPDLDRLLARYDRSRLGQDVYRLLIRVDDRSRTYLSSLAALGFDAAIKRAIEERLHSMHDLVLKAYKHWINLCTSTQEGSESRRSSQGSRLRTNTAGSDGGGSRSSGSFSPLLQPELLRVDDVLSRLSVGFAGCGVGTAEEFALS
eukprot:TRINITY_DN1382_c0_g2_i1.p1 TRINITY_DN1382_c0_g2~~TRINITY_DN1382_c0_g2_i1.p1  ORF type:complete len:1411 (-),score=289.38 TRINITY_DN1382_c0_g2_i1:36-4268(-)